MKKYTKATQAFEIYSTISLFGIPRKRPKNGFLSGYLENGIINV